MGSWGWWDRGGGLSAPVAAPHHAQRGRRQEPKDSRQRSGRRRRTAAASDAAQRRSGCKGGVPRAGKPVPAAKPKRSDAMARTTDFASMERAEGLPSAADVAAIADREPAEAQRQGRATPGNPAGSWIRRTEGITEDEVRTTRMPNQSQPKLARKDSTPLGDHAVTANRITDEVVAAPGMSCGLGVIAARLMTARGG